MAITFGALYFAITLPSLNPCHHMFAQPSASLTLNVLLVTDTSEYSPLLFSCLISTSALYYFRFLSLSWNGTRPCVISISLGLSCPCQSLDHLHYHLCQTSNESILLERVIKTYSVTQLYLVDPILTGQLFYSSLTDSHPIVFYKKLWNCYIHKYIYISMYIYMDLL